MLIEQDPDDHMLWLRTAPTLVLAGDEQAYRDFCDRMVKQFGDSTNLQEAESTCKACLLTPGAVDLTRLPLQAFAEPLDQGTAPAWLQPWAWAARALGAYRNDDVNQVSPYLQEVWRTNPSPAARALGYSIAALDRHRRRDFDGAREALGHVNQLIDQHMSNAKAGQLHDWLMPLILAREAQKLLDDQKAGETTIKSK